MASTPDFQSTTEMIEKNRDKYKELGTPDIDEAPEKIKKARDAYREFAGIQDEPSRGETILWYIHDLSSYFIHTVLIPIVFPLIISQIVSHSPVPEQGWSKSPKGRLCRSKEIQLYQAVTQHLISIGNANFSALNWTAISWVAGIIFSCPILVYVASLLDHGQIQPLIFGSATAIGGLFCLTTGFFKTIWLFPVYTATIIVANSIGVAFHTRHLGLMLRGATASLTEKHRFTSRKSVGSWLSLYGTAAGCAGAAIIASFTYHMLRHNDKRTSLWIVSIFSGLTWFIGLTNAMSGNRPSAQPAPDSDHWSHAFTIWKYPHAAGSLAGIFLSSFTSSCIFMGVLLYVSGELCFKPLSVFGLWLLYFVFPMVSLPLSHQLQLIIQSDAVRMQVLGFLLSAITAGFGYFFRHSDWRLAHVFFFTALQGTATGILHAYGRILLLDCSPPGKEGGFSVWLAWVKAAGSCAGFSVATSYSGDVRVPVGVSFCSAMGGIVVLVIGKVSNMGGAAAAGHLNNDMIDEMSPVHGLDNRSSEWKGSAAHL